MYSKVSKAKRCNRTKTKAVVVARILQKTASIPSQDTTHVPPQDTVPVSPQDPIPTIPQDPIPVTPQDAVPIPPQGAVPILLQDTVPVPPQDTVPVTPQVAIPRIPNDIIIEILDHLASASDVRSLRACALLSTLWAQPCRRHLFRAIRFTAATKPPQDIIPTPPRDTIPIPPQDTFPVLPQDIVLIIPQDTTPTIPHDIIDEILGHLARGSNFRSLRTCALVSGAWVKACQRHLFRTVHFTATNARKWFETFPVQEDSPAHLVRDLRIEIKQPASIPGKLFECISWFTNVERISLLGPWGYPLGGRFPPLCEPSFWKLPRSVTSLTVTIAITLVQVRDIVAQLPNLDDLVLTKFAEEDRTKLPVTGTGLKGTFGGRLILCGPCVREGIINMLLETPSGLHFAELEIYCTRNCLPSSAVRLAEACGKTLVKLSHTVRLHSNCKSYPFPLRLIRG